tara:strand:+ start:2231 stop:2407 length:177 start_codon:yes stop_codon:yes gene_type:complete
MEITLSLITFIVGFILGMYVVTQLEKGIDNNIKKEDEDRETRIYNESFNVETKDRIDD